MEEKTFSQSLADFIQVETQRRGWYKNGNINQNEVFRVLESLGEVTQVLAQELRRDQRV